MKNDYILMHGDCIDCMDTLPDQSVDLVLCDPPYGTTECKWDSVIPMDRMWECINRIIKDRTAVILTASQPFTSVLVCSNIENFRQSFVWEKNVSTGHLNANRMAMRSHEDVVMFYKNLPVYNPIKGSGVAYSGKHKEGDSGDCYGDVGESVANGVVTRNPTSIIKIPVVSGSRSHPTQKPVGLMEYFLKTYSNEGETVLDFTMGSGTTGVACVRNKRFFIGIERDDEYFKISEKRIIDETQAIQEELF